MTEEQEVKLRQKIYDSISGNSWGGIKKGRWANGVDIKIHCNEVIKIIKDYETEKDKQNDVVFRVY